MVEPGDAEQRAANAAEEGKQGARRVGATLGTMIGVFLLVVALAAVVVWLVF